MLKQLTLEVDTAVRAQLSLTSLTMTVAHHRFLRDLCDEALLVVNDDC